MSLNYFHKISADTLQKHVWPEDEKFKSILRCMDEAHTDEMNLHEDAFHEHVNAMKQFSEVPHRACHQEEKEVSKFY